jgi:hypothetical protein
MDFVYIAQYESQSTETLGYLQEALNKFHANKQALSAAGVRRGKYKKGKFNIKKLELMQHVGRLIEKLGSTPQFSSDQTERCHITMAKIPYRATNRRDYPEQMCRYLDRQEKARLFAMLLDWGSSQPEESLSNPTKAGGGRKTPSAPHYSKKFLPKETVDYFKVESPYVVRTDSTTFILPTRFTSKRCFVYEVASKYRIPQLGPALSCYLFRSACGSKGINYKDVLSMELGVWESFRIQLRNIQDKGIPEPPSTVQALPPSDEHQMGRCNFVLIKEYGSKVLGVCSGVQTA